MGVCWAPNSSCTNQTVHIIHTALIKVKHTLDHLLFIQIESNTRTDKACPFKRR